ncbi:hypothetical protein L873DRAFT_1378257 [Choiromyces venosus 120613-1]|uniref:Uncharacterized protein n=1 Tax=Choiromyces venosus 120613-1 TaxID=1336337 RepID=A0A3N4J9R1_9PEZI|nr:hypothetical protein L873DRAFT_1378257 [Choiromyces venosus 120613-1]
MERQDTRASKKRRAEEDPETLAFGSKKTKLDKTIDRSSVAKVKKKSTKTSSKAYKARKAITESAANTSETDAEANVSNKATKAKKPLKRKSRGDESDEELESPYVAKKAKVTTKSKGKNTVESVQNVAKTIAALKTSRRKVVEQSDNDISSDQESDSVISKAQRESVINARKGLRTKGKAKTKIGKSKTISESRKTITESAANTSETEVETSVGSKTAKNKKQSKRESRRDESDEELESPVVANKVKVTKKPKGRNTVGSVQNVAKIISVLKASRRKVVEQSDNDTSSDQESDSATSGAQEVIIINAGEGSKARGKAKLISRGSKNASKLPAFTLEIEESDEDSKEDSGDDSDAGYDKSYEIPKPRKTRGSKAQGKAKAKIISKGSKTVQASKLPTFIQEIEESDEDDDEVYEIPKPRKTRKTPIINTRSVTSSASSAANRVRGTFGRGVAGAASRDDPRSHSPVDSLFGGSEDESSPEQVPEVKELRNPFIFSDPNKPRPKGLGRLNFQESMSTTYYSPRLIKLLTNISLAPAYTKLMEVANKVKRAAKIMICKLTDLKTAGIEEPEAGTHHAAIVDASEKMEKFTRIYSPQIKFLSVDEFMDLLKAVVQSLGNGGGEEGAEIADPLLQKPLFAFLDGLKLSETQATTLGLYPVLELYWVGEEFEDELDPDVFAHIASIRDTLVRKNKASEDRLINHDYVPEDYLA